VLFKWSHQALTELEAFQQGKERLKKTRPLLPKHA